MAVKKSSHIANNGQAYRSFVFFLWGGRTVTADDAPICHVGDISQGPDQDRISTCTKEHSNTYDAIYVRTFLSLNTTTSRPTN